MTGTVDLETLIVFLQIVITITTSIVGAYLKSIRAEIEAIRANMDWAIRRIERLENRMMCDGCPGD